MCQPGRPRMSVFPSKVGVPAGLVGGGLLPQHEVAGVLLVALYGDAGASLLLVQATVRERAVIDVGGHVEQDLPALRALRDVGVALGDQRPIIATMPPICSVARGSCVGWEAAQRLHVGVELRGRFSVTFAMASFRSMSGKSRRARSMILSSTSVMLRT